MTKDEALKLAMDWYGSGNQDPDEFERLILSIVAQPEQEPVAFSSHGVVNWIADKQFQHEALLYFAPQRTWVGLTKEERHEISMANRPYCADVMAAHEEELKRRNT